MADAGSAKKQKKHEAAGGAQDAVDYLIKLAALDHTRATKERRWRRRGRLPEMHRNKFLRRCRDACSPIG